MKVGGERINVAMTTLKLSKIKKKKQKKNMSTTHGINKMNLLRKRKCRNRNIMKRGIQMKGRKCNGNSKEVTMSAPLVHTEKRKAKGRMTRNHRQCRQGGEGQRKQILLPTTAEI